MKKKGKAKEGKVKELRRQVKELEETVQRVQADFENTCKRLEREKGEAGERGKAMAMKDMLPFIDSMDAAIGKEGAGGNAEGIAALKSQLREILKKHGLEEIKSVGEQFDPRLHEAMMQGKEPGKKEGIVLEEFQKGYLLNGKVLRHSKVKVNKKG